MHDTQERAFASMGYLAIYPLLPPPYFICKSPLREWCQKACEDETGSLSHSDHSAYLSRIGRADERTRTAYPCSSYE
jgi:hypothetical protein